MFRFFSGFVLIAAAAAIAHSQFPLIYYLQPKQDRLYKLWDADLKKLSEDKNFANVFENVGKIEVHFTDPQVATEFERFNIPFKKNEGKPYILRISVTRWIEKNEYGFLVQHELFDETDNKVYEFGRTYKVGLIL